MILNKNRLFGGGLDLVNAAVIAISTSNIVVAQDDIRRARNELNQICWRIYANNRITMMKNNNILLKTWLNKYNDEAENFNDGLFDLEEDVKQNGWVADDYYRDSIINVIGKAIGDWVTGEGAFAKETGDGVVTFENTNLKNYSMKHWNAVMLYNYVKSRILAHQAEERDGEKRTDHDCLQYCYDKVFEHYRDNYKNIYDTHEKVDQLYKDLYTSLLDIAAYNRALDLGTRLAKVARAAYYYDPDGDGTWINYIAPDFERYRGDQNFAKLTPSKYKIKLWISHKLTEKEAQFAEDNNVYISNEFNTLDYLTGYDYVNGKLYLSSIRGPYRKKTDELHDYISTSAKNMKYFYQYVLDLLDGLVNLPDEDLIKYRPYMQEQLANEEKERENGNEEMVENEEYVEDVGYAENDRENENEQYEEEYNGEEMEEQQYEGDNIDYSAYVNNEDTNE